MLKRLDVAEVLAAEDHHNRNRRLLQFAGIGVAAVIVIAAAGWVWWTWQARTVSAYLTDTVTRGDLSVSLVATGTIEPTRKVEVSSLVSGTILSVDVDYNQSITKGQALAHIDPGSYDAQRKHAMAAVEAQAANRDAAATAVTDAQAALRRALDLPSAEVISDKDVELATTALARARANLAVAAAQLDVAEADLASAQSDYERTTIVSPIDGTVLDYTAEPGQTVSAALLTAPLFTLAADLKSLEVDVDVDEADVPQIKVGDKASFTVESAPDQPVLGTILQVRQSPKVSDGVTSYTAVVAVDNTAGTLRPGMTATVSIETDHATQALTVPNAALRFVPKGGPAVPAEQQEVHVLQNGTLHAVVVTTGITDGQRTSIRSDNLVPGDVVVTGVKDH